MIEKLEVNCRTSDDDSFRILYSDNGITFHTTRGVEVLLSNKDIIKVIDILHKQLIKDLVEEVEGWPDDSIKETL